MKENSNKSSTKDDFNNNIGAFNRVYDITSESKFEESDITNIKKTTTRKKKNMMIDSSSEEDVSSYEPEKDYKTSVKENI